MAKIMTIKAGVQAVARALMANPGMSPSDLRSKAAMLNRLANEMESRKLVNV